MAKRHGKNPAKVKVDLEAISDSPPELTERTLRIRRRFSVALMCLLTAVLLMASLPPFNAWFLAYVALVPWTLALAGGTRRRWTLLWAWLAGVVMWSLTLYWLWWILLLSWDASVGFIALVAYMSAYWLVAALVLRAALRRDWPMWIVLPVVWVALEYVRAHLISGFPWFNLAMSQHARTRLIQISDMTGNYGVSFFVAMVNGAIVDLLCGPLFQKKAPGVRLSRRFAVAGGACAAVLVFLLAYGTYRLNQNSRRPGPVVGVVQQSFPIWLDELGAPSNEILAAHIEATRASLLRADCDLVVWPETMLPRGLNREFIELNASSLSQEQLRSLMASFFVDAGTATLPQLRDALDQGIQPRLREQARELEELSRRLECPILAGGASIHLNPQPLFPGDHWLTYNSAMIFDDDWRHSQRYSKVQLVPFSEYVPFRKSWPWLHKVLRWFVPPVMDQLAPGEEYTLLHVAPSEEADRSSSEKAHGRPSVGSGVPAPATAPAATTPAEEAHGTPSVGIDREKPKGWNLAVPICYEGTFPHVCRRMVYQDGRKAADVLVNISNDGWFMWKWGPWRGQGSSEHAQHLSHYVFRAIENRVPVVRAVNTGISASIDSNGRVVSQVHQRGIRTGVAGTMVLGGQAAPGEPPALRRDGILVDSRVSLYSKVGDAFAIAVSVLALALATWLVWTRRRQEGTDDAP